jgi:hypothetical protein
MGLHQIKKLLHIKENNCQNQETIHRMEEKSASYSTGKGLISRIFKELLLPWNDLARKIQVHSQAQHILD